MSNNQILTREESLKERALQILNIRYLNEADIKASYRRRIFDYHPDRHPESKDNPEYRKECETKIMAINQAYDLLQEVLHSLPVDFTKYCLLEDTALTQLLLPADVRPAPLGKTEQEIWIDNFKDRF